MSASASSDISLPLQVIDRPGFTLKFYPLSDLAELVIRENAVLDEQMAIDSKKLIEETRPGRRCFLLVSSDGFFKLTKKARRLGADLLFSSHIAAVSCYTGNATLSLLGELYTKINKPASPTKVFYSREAAIEWLLEQMPAGGNLKDKL